MSKRLYREFKPELLTPSILTSFTINLTFIESCHSFVSIVGMQISRPYTVVLPSLQVGPTEREYDGQRFYLMIKIYPGGTLTPTLSSVEAGQLV